MRGCAGLIAGIIIAGSASSAQQLEFLYQEPVGGVYTQDWSGRLIGADPLGGVLFYVRGDGKSGDFHGVLAIDCDTPERSSWVAEGGVIGPDNVPANVIDIMRAQACGSP